MADDIVQRLAAQALGEQPPSPEAAAAATQQVPTQQAPTAPQAPSAPAPTVGEIATELASPNTEGDNTELDAAVFDVDFGDGRTRQLNSKQIRDTFKRYSELNTKWSQNSQRMGQMEPLIGFAETLMQAAQQSGQQVSPQDIVGFLQQAIQGGNSSSFGATGSQPQSGAPNSPDAFAQWEEEHSIPLPPGVRESAARIQGLETQLQQTNGLLQQILQAQQGVAQTASAAANNAQQQNISAVQRSIANNLNQAQQYFQLPDDAEQEFFNFASARGYTIEDFVDPELTMAVVGDYKNNLNSPEMERLRSIAQRRQAYTGSMQTAAGAGAGTAPNADDQYFASLVEGAMKK